MPIRAIPFVTGQIYHIYNRGSEKRWIFENKWMYHRFLKTADYYQHQGPKPQFSHFLQSINELKTDLNIEILSFCLMPNHYHFLVRQLKDNGITEMFSKLANSYTKYFNTRLKRVGPLFQGEFKAVLIENDEQLLHVSRYIHLNPVVANLVLKPADYEWSSYTQFTENSPGICSTSLILDIIGSRSLYKEFVEDQIDYAKSLELLKHQLIDD